MESLAVARWRPAGGHAIQRGPSPTPMAVCQAQGCKTEVPAALGESALCVLHYLVWLDGNCAAMRRETAPTGATTARHDEIAGFIREHGERLSHVATCGIRLSDDMKARVLNAFLSLMNLRENLERAMERAARAGPAK
jgi:hypothetical protein